MRSKEPIKRKLESSKPNNVPNVKDKKKKRASKKYNAEEENLSQLG
jgi:hypothetical protein